MLGLVILFFVLALVAAVFGFSGIAGALGWMAWIVLAVFLVLFVVSLIGGEPYRSSGQRTRPETRTQPPLIFPFSVG